MGSALRPGSCSGVYAGRLKPTNDSWRVDETYIRVKGKWRYLYRAVDSSGATLDFLLSAKQDAAAAKRFLTKALAEQTIRRRESSTPTSMPLTRRRLCNSKTKVFWRRTANIDRCSTSIMSWNRITGPSSAGSAPVNIFRSFWGAWRTIAGYEAIHMIRKGQACWSAAGVKVGLLHRFIVGMFGIEA